MKKRHIYIAIAAMMSTSCSDDYFNKDVDVEYSEYIGYSINVTGSDQFQARSAGAMASHEARQLTIDATGLSIGGRPLYLHTEVVDSIPQAVTRAKNGESALSRGTVTYTGGLTDIGLSAVVFDGEKDAWPASDNSLSAQMYMHNDKLTAPWQTNRYWPRENDWIRFYAYAPYGALDDETVDNTVGLPAISTAEPSFSYTIANNIPDQVDLLVGSEQYQGEWCQTAKLDLCHALSAVNIRIDGDVAGFTLNTLTISGLQNRGTYTYNYNESTVGDGDNTTQTHDAGSWSNQGTTDGGGTYTVYPTAEKKDPIQFTGTGSSELKDEDGNTVTYTDMTAGNMVLLMMPQVLTDAATITITGHDEVLNKDVTLSASIVGTKEWEKGKMYTYTLSFTSTKIEYFLKVTILGNVDDIPYYGIKDQAYTVKSYKEVTRSGLGTVTYAVPWQAVQIDGAGNESELPAGLQLAATTGPGVDLTTAQLESYTYCLLPNLDGSSSQSHTTLVAATQKGKVDDPYNLSTNKLYSATSEPDNTANCYVVSAPGYYTFPLVYGNAITAGMTNTSAYAPYSSTDYYQTVTLYTNNTAGESVPTTETATVPCKRLIKFKDHNDAAIENPWIVKTSTRGGKYTPDHAEIVWQDEPCLVTDVELNATDDYITFRVNEETICEGNAVIAIKDANDVTMWSWHIWVTDGINRYDTGSGSSAFIDTDGTPSTLVLNNRRVTGAGWKDYDPDAASPVTKPVEGTYTDQQFDMMRILLGHCDGETKNYQARTIKVRFKQVEAADAEFVGTPLYNDDVTLNQTEGIVRTTDNIPYYQYGRKDPMLPGGGDGDGNTDKWHYDNDWGKLTSIKQEERRATIGEAIQAPDKFFATPGVQRSASNNYVCCDWRLETSNETMSGPYSNLWNSGSWSVPAFSYNNLYIKNEGLYNFHSWFDNLIESGVTKTVYDPCPPGFELPRIDAFTGASYNGKNVHPAYYNGVTDGVEFARIGYFDITDINKAQHKYANIRISPNGSPYDATSELYNGISIYCETMKEVGVCGNPTHSNGIGGDTLFVHYMGQRGSSSAYKPSIGMWGQYASALTCSPTCMQWMDQSINSYVQYELARFCSIKSTDDWQGTGIKIPYSLRVTSTSSLDLAFGIIPARTGKNPANTVANGNVGWSGAGNSGGGYDVEF